MARPDWHRYEQLRPDQLADVVSRTPVAFWPLGLLEHHGWHLPVGFDGLKADSICQRVAARTGGVILPVMWWGGGGRHGPFKWTHYQEGPASGEHGEQGLSQVVDYLASAIDEHLWQT